MEFYERASGARMHAAYVRPGGVALVRKLNAVRLLDRSFARSFVAFVHLFFA